MTTTVTSVRQPEDTGLSLRSLSFQVLAALEHQQTGHDPSSLDLLGLAQAICLLDQTIGNMRAIAGFDFGSICPSELVCQLWNRCAGQLDVDERLSRHREMLLWLRCLWQIPEESAILVRDLWSELNRRTY